MGGQKGERERGMTLEWHSDTDMFSPRHSPSSVAWPPTHQTLCLVIRGVKRRRGGGLQATFKLN